MIFCLVLAAGTQVSAQSPRVPARMQFADISLRIKEDARKEIQEDVDKLTRNPKYFNIHVQRARTYFPIIERIFREEGVPDDFKYLVIQESALVADAVSSSDAVGFWQFKDFTAKEMGLRVDRQVDERKNIVSSSRAAAQYVKKNNGRFFDNWLISLQAYQMGPGGALKAGGEKYKGHKSMTIDRRTYWYIKKYLAHKVAFEDALNGPAVVSVKEYWNGADKSFRDIARETGINESEIETYNKWLDRGKIPNDKRYAVIIPVTAATGLPVDYGTPAIASTTMRGVKQSYAVEYEFARPNEFPAYGNRGKAEQGLVTQINGRKAIIAKQGDRAVSLATKGDISLRKFYKFNDLDENARVMGGQVYYLQRKKSKQAAYHHVVNEGETFWSISQKYGIKEKKLLTRNRLRKEVPLQEGRILWLHYIRPRDVPVEFVRPEPEEVPVVVKKDAKRAQPQEEIDGEELFAESGDEAVEILSVDDEEEVPKWPASAPAMESEKGENRSAEAEKRKPVAEVEGQEEKVHVVRTGETLYSISRKYGVRIDDILEWNELKITDPLSIDQKLRLYGGETMSVPETAENEEIYYTVQNGDTFYGISRKFDVPVSKLKEMNNKTDDLLKPGERIRVQ